MKETALGAVWFLVARSFNCRADRFDCPRSAGDSTLLRERAEISFSHPRPVTPLRGAAHTPTGCYAKITG